MAGSRAGKLQAGCAVHVLQWEGLCQGCALCAGQKGVCWQGLLPLTLWHGSFGTGDVGLTCTKPLGATSSCAGSCGAGREGLCVMPAPLFLSLAATAQLSQHSPALQECGMPFFFPHIFFPWNTALLQSIPCSFPRSCSSYDLLSSKKMRCPHPKQCLYTWDPALPPSLWLTQSHCQIWLPDIYHRLCWNSFPFTFHLSEDD